MLDFYSASSLKQQSADRHVISPVHIILITRQPVPAASYYPFCFVNIIHYSVLSRKEIFI
jgi:hypothetical protein